MMLALINLIFIFVPLKAGNFYNYIIIIICAVVNKITHLYTSVN